MSAPYRDLAELVLGAVQGRDYRVSVTDRNSEITIATVHGGGIEPLASELVAAVAGEEYNLYDFAGIVQDSAALRIPVGRFVEMRLQALMCRSQTALAIEGIPGTEPMLHLGGKNRRLKRALAVRLQEVGFEVRPPAGPGAAHDPGRFYNWPAEGGVQVELTHALRESLVDCPLRDFLWQNPACWNDRFAALIIALRGAIEQYRVEARADLGCALERFEQDTKRLRGSIPSCAEKQDE